jgi:hypothetical protein
MTHSEHLIQGSCEPDFDAVRDAFAENFAHGELGASCAVTIEGELVVDLWGGHRDLARRLPWERDTLVNVWSTTKMFAALCTLMLHDRGELSVDAPMARYWPEFAASGKEGVLVRHVLGHTAGLPVFDELIDDLTSFDLSECCQRLASQTPRWTPGEGSGYHAETQGYLLGETTASSPGWRTSPRSTPSPTTRAIPNSARSISPRVPGAPHWLTLRRGAERSSPPPMHMATPDRSRWRWPLWPTQAPAAATPCYHPRRSSAHSKFRPMASTA